MLYYVDILHLKFLLVQKDIKVLDLIENVQVDHNFLELLKL